MHPVPLPTLPTLNRRPAAGFIHLKGHLCFYSARGHGPPHGHRPTACRFSPVLSEAASPVQVGWLKGPVVLFRFLLFSIVISSVLF